MLYCPNCGAEYREGFSSCSDCHVLLVPESRQDFRQESVPEPGDPNKDPFCAFWQGSDLRICAELCTVLDEAAIPHKTIHRQDHLFNLSNQAPYKIGVPASCYEKAEHAVKEAYGSEEESQRLLNPTAENSPSYRELVELPSGEKWAGRPEEEQPSLIDSLTWRKPSREGADDSAQAPRIGSKSEDSFPEDATAEVWTGNPAELQEIIEMSLRENNIRTRWEGTEEKPVVFVFPQDEARAREIVREIIEGTPLE